MPTFPQIFPAKISAKTKEASQRVARNWHRINRLNEVPPVIYLGTEKPTRAHVEQVYQPNEVIIEDYRHFPRGAAQPWWMVMLPTFDQFTEGSLVIVWLPKSQQKIVREGGSSHWHNTYCRVVSVCPASQTVTVRETNPLRGGEFVQSEEVGPFVVNIDEIFSVVNECRTAPTSV
jgi:hypothetical protein